MRFVSEYNTFICYDKQADASVVKRISRLASNQLFQVRVLASAQEWVILLMFEMRTWSSGYDKRLPIA